MYTVSFLSLDSTSWLQDPEFGGSRFYLFVLLLLYITGVIYGRFFFLVLTYRY